MGYRVLKISLFIIAATVAFIAAQYYWGIWPDGIRAQESRYHTSAQGILQLYQKEQNFFQQKHGSYSANLHLQPPFNKSTTVVIGYASDRQDIAKACPDCTFSLRSYKIGAYGTSGSHLGIWIVRQAGAPELQAASQ